MNFLSSLCALDSGLGGFGASFEIWWVAFVLSRYLMLARNSDVAASMAAGHSPMKVVRGPHGCVTHLCGLWPVLSTSAGTVPRGLILR